jgi:serine/threonine-protein kinase
VLKVCPQCRIELGPDQEVCPVDGTPLVSSVPTVSTAGDPLVGQILADRYRVIRTIGEGGMGRVYLAEHVRMGRLSAVKVMSPSLAPTPEAISRFNREAANASRINHPNVAAIYDFGETPDGTTYLAMEYVEGQTLSGILRQDGPLAPARAAELTGQIAEGLSAAHHLGIVHRDLKPDNVLVTRTPDGRELAKIVDFGIAKATQAPDQTVTSLGVAIGTPEFMSPEQIAGDALDARTDLYSLGLVLFNMLTGTLPHDAMTSKQSLVNRLTQRPRTLAEVRPSAAWSPRLQKTLDRALAPEPDDRYANVGDFARDVRGAVGMPIFANRAASAMGALTRAMTPATVPVVPASPTTSGARTVELPRRKRGGLVMLVLLVLIVSGAALALRPPAALRALVAPRWKTIADAAATQHDSTSAHPPTDSSAAVIPAGTAFGTTTTPVDSTAADSAHGSADSLSPLDGGLRLRRAAMQAQLRANGDSSAGGAIAATTQSADSDSREVMIHVNRARELSRTMQLKGAGMELRTAYEEYRIFLSEHASAPQIQMLQSELQAAMDQALGACHAARDSVATHGGHPIRCEHPAKSGILVVDDDTPPARSP